MLVTRIKGLDGTKLVTEPHCTSPLSLLHRRITFMNQLVLTVTGISSAPRPAPSTGKPAAAAAAADAFRSAVCRRSLAFLRAACKI